MSNQFLRFNPPKLETKTPEVVHQYLERSEGADFVMADAIRVKSRVADIEKKTLEDRVESQVLDRLKEIQETAYREGFEVGQADGKKEAFLAQSSALALQIEDLEKLVGSFDKIKSEILHASEMHFVKFALYLAERLAFHEITHNPEALINLVRKSVEMAQGEDKVVIRLSPDQLSTIENFKSEMNLGVGLDSMKNVHLESDPNISPGGCVVQTNFSEVDARIEERVKTLWELMSDQIVNVKDQLSA